MDQSYEDLPTEPKPKKAKKKLPSAKKLLEFFMGDRCEMTIDVKGLSNKDIDKLRGELKETRKKSRQLLDE